MSFSSVDELAQALLHLRLVDPVVLNQCRAELGAAGASPEGLLRGLENRGLLTAYQIGKLSKGETDGLVLANYKLLYQNASGSFARVYRAATIPDGRMIGLKVLRSRWVKDPNVITQFRREAELCKKLRHRNIAPIYDVQNDGDAYFFTMEFVEGGNLRDFLRIRGRLSPVEATKCVLDLAEGLDYALRQGFTHRDLKLTNVLMSTSGVAKLIDFGLAGNDSLSGSKDGDGTQRAIEYATLEKGSGAPDDDPRSDLYFLGAIYYELLTGTPPYPPTRSREERKQFSRYSMIRPLREVDPSLPATVAEIVERLMKVNPYQRYQRPADVIVDLRRALSELGEPATGPAAAPRNEPSQPTVLCIESRTNYQDVLRDYLSKRGFRVLMLSDVRRALGRLKSNPPDCLVLMAEPLGDEVIDAWQQIAQAVGERPLARVAVLVEKQADLRDQLDSSPTARVLVRAKLRDLREEIAAAMKEAGVQQQPAEA